MHVKIQALYSAKLKKPLINLVYTTNGHKLDNLWLSFIFAVDDAWMFSSKEDCSESENLTIVKSN